MRAKELDLTVLKEYLTKTYGYEMNKVATELRKLAIDYARVNLILEAYGGSYISGSSCEYLEMLSSLSDTLDKSI